MKTLLLGVAIIAVSTFDSGCATIIKGTHQDIPIASDPAGAAVLIDGVREGSTPMSAKLARKREHVVTITMDGYETENVTLRPSMGAAVAGNIIAGGLIGWGVDAGTGAQYNLHPDSVDVHLRKLAASPTLQTSQVTALLTELDRLDQMKSAGKLSTAEYEQLRSATLKKYQ